LATFTSRWLPLVLFTFVSLLSLSSVVSLFSMNVAVSISKHICRVS
jgi:phage terminase large subunit-like protein